MDIKHVFWGITLSFLLLLSMRGLCSPKRHCQTWKSDLSQLRWLW